MPHDLQITIPVAEKTKTKCVHTCTHTIPVVTPIFPRLSEEVWSMWKWMCWLILDIGSFALFLNPMNKRKTKFLNWLFNASNCLHILSHTWLTSFTWLGRCPSTVTWIWIMCSSLCVVVVVFFPLGIPWPFFPTEFYPFFKIQLEASPSLLILLHGTFVSLSYLLICDSLCC